LIAKPETFSNWKSGEKEEDVFKRGFKYSMRLSARPISTRAECRMAEDALHVQRPSLPIGIPDALLDVHLIGDTLFGLGRLH
jgi:hypothetical protein